MAASGIGGARRAVSILLRASGRRFLSLSTKPTALPGLSTTFEHMHIGASIYTGGVRGFHASGVCASDQGGNGKDKFVGVCPRCVDSRLTPFRGLTGFYRCEKCTYMFEVTQLRDQPQSPTMEQAGAEKASGSGPAAAAAAAGEGGVPKEEPLWMKDMPNPRMIYEHLDQYVVGQETAKKVLAVAVYNHYKRVRANLARKEAMASDNAARGFKVCVVRAFCALA
eukprot:Opistho-2@35754